MSSGETYFSANSLLYYSGSITLNYLIFKANNTHKLKLKMNKYFKHNDIPT